MCLVRLYEEINEGKRNTSDNSKGRNARLRRVQKPGRIKQDTEKARLHEKEELMESFLPMDRGHVSEK